MAIQISGTTVISDARELQNIINLPASANVAVFNSTGTWNKPAGYPAESRVYIQVWGGGGSGGCGNQTNRATGGGGGGYAESWTSLSALSSTESVIIGAGGPGRSTVGVGTTGGTSSFGSLISAYGGSGGRGSSTGVFGEIIGGFGGGSLSEGKGSPDNLPGKPVVVTDAVFVSGTTFSPAAVDVFYQGSGLRDHRDAYIHGAGGADGVSGGLGSSSAGQSIWGGGGGGAFNQPGGVSVNGGNGGNYQANGAQPAGGGGASGVNGELSGAGGAGRVIVTVIPT
jgi:hypothetical protein